MQKSVEIFNLPSTKDDISIVTFLPDNYDSSKTYPVHIYLAGAGEKVWSTTNLNPNLLTRSLPKYITDGTFNPNYIVLVPQNRYGDYENTGGQGGEPLKQRPGQFTNDVVKYAKDKYKTDKVAVSAISAGAISLYHFLNLYNASNPVIAVTPVAGYLVDFSSKKSNTKIWGFQGEKDAIDNFRNVLDAAKKTNPDVDIRYTTYPNRGHEAYVWDTAFANNDWRIWMNNALGAATTIPTAPENSLPGKVEAEKYSSMLGIKTETSSEGTLNVGWIEEGDFMEYKVFVTKGGIYDITFRIATSGSGRKFKLVVDGVDLSTLTLPKTGGYQVWDNVTTKVTLKPGEQVFRIEALTAGWNFNYFEVKEDLNSTVLLNAPVMMELSAGQKININGKDYTGPMKFEINK